MIDKYQMQRTEFFKITPPIGLSKTENLSAYLIDTISK